METNFDSLIDIEGTKKCATKGCDNQIPASWTYCDKCLRRMTSGSQQ